MNPSTTNVAEPLLPSILCNDVVTNKASKHISINSMSSSFSPKRVRFQFPFQDVESLRDQGHHQEKCTPIIPDLLDVSPTHDISSTWNNNNNNNNIGIHRYHHEPTSPGTGSPLKRVRFHDKGSNNGWNSPRSSCSKKSHSFAMPVVAAPPKRTSYKGKLQHEQNQAEGAVMQRKKKGAFAQALIDTENSYSVSPRKKAKLLPKPMVRRPSWNLQGIISRMVS
jgi:hypothetical protein